MQCNAVLISSVAPFCNARKRRKGTTPSIKLMPEECPKYKRSATCVRNLNRWLCGLRTQTNVCTSHFTVLTPISHHSLSGNLVERRGPTYFGRPSPESFDSNCHSLEARLIKLCPGVHPSPCLRNTNGASASKNK